MPVPYFTFCPNRTTVRTKKFPKLILNGPIYGHFGEKLILNNPLCGHSDEFSLIAVISKPYRIIKFNKMHSFRDYHANSFTNRLTENRNSSTGY